MEPSEKPFSVLVAHEGRTTTLGILERGLEYLHDIHGVSYRVVELTETDHSPEVAEDDVVVLLRNATGISVEFTEALRSNGKSYLYYVDDDFWSLDIGTGLGQFYRHPATRRALATIVAGAAEVITNSAVLAERILARGGHVRVIPAFFDFSLLESEQLHARPITKPADVVRIGFASNVSRMQDLADLEPALRRILSEYPHCELEVIGLTPGSLHGSGRVRSFPHLESYSAYIRFQLDRQWDIGLAPLRKTRQNIAKTNNKYREYGAMGIPGVYANLPPYAEVVPEQTGMQAGSPTEWYEAIRSLVESQELRERIRQQAQDDVRWKYDVPVVAEEWFDAFSVGIEAHDPHRPIPRQKLLHRADRSYAVWYLYRTQGPLRGSYIIVRHVALGVRSRLGRLYRRLAPVSASRRAARSGKDGPKD